MTIINNFYSDKESFSEKERLLKETIEKRHELIVSNDEQYKSLLIDGKEDEADVLFKENSELKEKQKSESAKLSSYKQIHQEALVNKALEVLDNDLIELKKKYKQQYTTILQEESDLHEKLRQNNLNKMNLQQEISKEFNRYESLTEEYNLRELHKSRFNKEPYTLIRHADGTIQREAAEKVK